MPGWGRIRGVQPRRRVMALLPVLGLGALALGVLAGLPSWSSPEAASANRPDWAEAGPGGVLYVANLRSSEVTAVDVAQGTIVGRWAMAVNPHEFARDGATLYVSNYRSGQISTIALESGDLDSGRVRVRTADGIRPHGLGLDAQGTLWWTTADGQLRSGRGQTIAVGAVPHAVVIDGTLDVAYVAEAGAGTVSKLSLATGVLLRRAAAGALVESIALDAAGETLVAAAADAGQVTAFAAADLSERWRTTLAGRPARVLVSGERVLVSLSLAGTLAILELSSGALLATVPVGLLPDGIAVDGSGRYAFVATAGSDRVAVVDLAEGRMLGTLPSGEGPSGVLWAAGVP